MFTPADRQLAERASAQHAVFTLPDAVECGLTEPQIRLRAADVWLRVHDGVFRIPGGPRTWYGDLLAACLAAGQPVAISHWAAAALYDLPGGRHNTVELTCPRWDRTQHPGIIVHESRTLTSTDIVSVEQIPVVPVELLLLQLASQRPSVPYLEAVIHAARRKRLITYDSTIEVFTRHRRRGLKGVRALRNALALWNPSQRHTESEMETLLLQVLRAHDLPEPVLQYEVHDRNGLFVARTDATYPQWRATIDYDSKQEHSDEFQIARDNRRRNRIIATRHHHFVARYDDLRQGGHDLCDQLREVASELAV